MQRKTVHEVNRESSINLLQSNQTAPFRDFNCSFHYSQQLHLSMQTIFSQTASSAGERFKSGFSCPITFHFLVVKAWDILNSAYCRSKRYCQTDLNTSARFSFFLLEQKEIFCKANWVLLGSRGHSVSLLLSHCFLLGKRHRFQGFLRNSITWYK